MSISITTDRLTKYYGAGRTPALAELSLQVGAGEIYGFLGANGAGKSTTIRLLLNFLQPTSGTAQILGLDVQKASVRVKKQVGYLAGDVALYGRVTGRQLLDYLSSLQPASGYRKVLEKRFEADLDKPIESLSKGNRQKLGIIQAFMHEPAVLILDEPTSGLDPLMQEAFYETLRDAKGRGAAILMSSHLLDEAQRVCDRVGIIKHGRLIREQALKGDAQLTTPTFKVTFAAPEDLEHCRHSPHLKLIGKVEGLSASFQAKGPLNEALAALARYPLRDVSTHTLDLEDEFLDFYGDDS